MAIKRITGQPNNKPFKKKASEAFAVNDVVTRDTSGYVTKATATTPRNELLGLITRDVLSTDDDYAQNSVVVVDCFEGSGREDFEASVGTGSAVQAMVGKNFDLKDENELDVNKEFMRHFKIERVLSTTLVRGGFCLDNQNPGRRIYRQTITRSEFTDGGSTSGTKALNVSIPVGAVYVQTLIDDVTGFTGDTSAVVIVGDGTDTDRYNTGTPSVFTTADAIDAGVPSGTKFHSAAKTPTVTVTSNADFTNVSAGQMTVTMIWEEATA